MAPWQSQKGWNSSTLQGWTCKVCATENWAKHKCCWTCRAVRSYAEVTAAAAEPDAASFASSPQYPQTQSNGQILQQQLGMITKQLTQVVSDEIDSAPSEAACLNAAEDKQIISHQLQNLITSLAALPDCPEFSTVRAQIQKQIDDTKAKISHTKPLGARMDGCRNALDRARKRQATAEAAFQAATLAREAADAQVQKYMSELAELETLVSDEAQKKESSTCLTRLQKEMQLVVKERSSSFHVDGSEAALALQQMTALFQNLTDIAAKSQAAAATSPGEQARLQQMLYQNARQGQSVNEDAAMPLASASQAATLAPAGPGGVSVVQSPPPPQAQTSLRMHLSSYRDAKSTPESLLAQKVTAAGRRTFRNIRAVGIYGVGATSRGNILT